MQDIHITVEVMIHESVARPVPVPRFGIGGIRYEDGTRLALLVETMNESHRSGLFREWPKYGDCIVHHCTPMQSPFLFVYFTDEGVSEGEKRRTEMGCAIGVYPAERDGDRAVRAGPAVMTVEQFVPLGSGFDPEWEGA
jgi:hypothetical protein